MNITKEKNKVKILLAMEYLDCLEYMLFNIHVRDNKELFEKQLVLRDTINTLTEQLNDFENFLNKG